MDEEPKTKRPRSEAEVTPQSFWKAQLEAIYVRRNPMKVDSIPELLQKYEGSEAVLYKKVCHKYDLNPNKFHTEPEAWLEYELTEHHGATPAEAQSAGSENADATLEVEVSTISGEKSFKVVDLKPWNTVKDVLIRASVALGAQAWCSKLCDGTNKLSINLPLSGVTSAAGSRLTLVQEPCPELTNVFEQFMPGQLPGQLEGTADCVHVAWCQDFELSFSSLRSTVVLGAFRDPRHAREAVVEAVTEAYHGAMNDDFIGEGGEDPIICSSANNVSLSRPDLGIRKVWQVERGPLR